MYNKFIKTKELYLNWNDATYTHVEESIKYDAVLWYKIWMFESV